MGQFMNKVCEDIESECCCITRVRYSLQCADIPLNIFRRFICPQHSGSGSDNREYVQCLLHHDAFVADSDDISAWETTYHGAPVPTIHSILLHGELLMEGDVLCDGAYLDKRQPKSKDEKPAIWTYPKREGADNRTELATYDEGQTAFKALLELRQRPGTFTKHKTRLGYEIYATSRRGTILFWALHIHVQQSKSEVMSAALNQPIPPILQIGLRSSSCHVQIQALKALKSLNIPPGMFDKRFDQCHCSSCFLDLLPRYKTLAGEKFIEPRGWVKFGLKVNEGFVKMNDIWDCWNSAFHGCRPSKVISILKHRSLRIPGDELCDGTKLGVNSSADVNQKCYFFSPLIVYSSHPWYAQFKEIGDRYFQTVLLFKVRPGSFDKQRETEGGEMLMFDDYSIIGEDEIEWCSSRRGCTMPYAVLIRVITKEQHDIITNNLIHNPVAMSYRLQR